MSVEGKTDHTNLDRGHTSPLLETYRPRATPQPGLSRVERQKVIDAWRKSLADGDTNAGAR